MKPPPISLLALLGVGLLGALLPGAMAPAPARADWDAQVSARVHLGGGLELREPTPGPADPMGAGGLLVEGVLDLGLRSEVLFGPALPGTVRLGPAFELRTDTFRSLDLALGAQLFVPTGIGFGFWITAGAGYAFSEQQGPGGQEGAFLLGTVVLGFRPWNIHSAYAYGLGAYVSGRLGLGALDSGLDAPRGFEILAGVEVDCEFLFAIPFMFFYELVNAHDPGEPLVEDNSSQIENSE